MKDYYKRDPNQSKYRKWYAAEFKEAKTQLAPLNGVIDWSTYDYEAFRFTAEGVKLIFYPHKTSAGNYHIRVRDGGSASKDKLDEALRLLWSNKNSCTFSVKNDHRSIHDKSFRNLTEKQ